MELEGRTAVVTGASSGIGRATAEVLGAEGAEVLLLARTESDLEAVAEDVRAGGGEAAVYPVDLADREAVATAADRIRDAVGDPTVLVNSAGAGSWTSILEDDPGHAEACMAVPYFGAYNLTRELLPGMVSADAARIVNVGSPGGYTAIPGATAYTAARFAMRGFTEALHVELAQTSVGVTEVVPGLVETEYFERNDNVRERLPTGAGLRSVSPEQVGVELVRGIKAGKRRVTLPAEVGATLALGRHFPDAMSRLLTRTGWQPDGADRE